MVLYSPNDDLTETEQRLHKQEKETDRREAKAAADRAGRRHVIPESLDTQHKSSFGWCKHPEEVQEARGFPRLFKYVKVKHNGWGEVENTEPAQVILAVDREGADLYFLRLKKVGEEIKEEQAGWKLRDGAAVRVGREEQSEELMGRGTKKPFLFRELMTCELEGEWIVELMLQKASARDWFFRLTGELCEGCWTPEQRFKAEDLGRHWYYEGRFHDTPPETALPSVTARRRPQKNNHQTARNQLRPQNGRNRISKPKTRTNNTDKLSTVARLAPELTTQLDLSDPTSSRSLRGATRPPPALVTDKPSLASRITSRITSWPGFATARQR